MANVDVVIATSNGDIETGNRVSVRTSGDRVYIFTTGFTASNPKLIMSKGNVNGEPASFTAIDTIESITGLLETGGACAIDSNNIIHCIYYVVESMGTTAIRYVTFNTGTDTFGTPETIATLDDDSTTTIFQILSIAIDNNNDPHVLWIDALTSMGTTTYTIWYSNKISGWATRVSVFGTTVWNNWKGDIMIADPLSSVNADRPIIIIRENNSRINGYYGGALNATSFTEETDVTGAINPNNSTGISAAIDSNEKIVIVFTENTTHDLMIVEHLNASAWTSWETPVDVDTSSDYLEPSITTNGTDRYILVEDTTNSDLNLWKDEGSGWTEETTDADLPNVGTFADVNVKFANYNNNSPTDIDYVFEDSGGKVLYNTFAAGGGLSTVGRTFNLRHDVAVFVGRTFDLRHDVKIEVGRTFDLRHDVKIEVGRTFNLRHDIRELVGRTFNLRHDLREFVGRTFNLRHDILSLIGRTFNLRHDVSILVGRSFNLRHDIIGAVGRTFNLRHDIKVFIGRTFNLRHDIKGIIGRTFNLRHDVKVFVGRTFNIRHDIAEFIGRTFNLRHDLGGAVGRTFNLRHDVKLIVGRTFNIRHDIKSLIGRTFNLRHDIAVFVGRTFNIRHDLAGGVGRTFNLRHDILVFVGRTFNLRHDIKSIVGRTFNLRHDIANFVGRTFTLRHDLAGAVGRSFNLRHDIANFIGRTFNLRHDISVFVGNTFNLRHDILSVIGNTFNLRHDVSVFVGRTFNLRHDLEGAVGRTFALRHSILAVVDDVIRTLIRNPKSIVTTQQTGYYTTVLKVTGNTVQLKRVLTKGTTMFDLKRHIIGTTKLDKNTKVHGITTLKSLIPTKGITNMIHESKLKAHTTLRLKTKISETKMKVRNIKRVILENFELLFGED